MVWREILSDEGLTTYVKLVPSMDRAGKEYDFPFVELRVSTRDRKKIESIGGRVFSLEGITSHEYFFKNDEPAGYSGSYGEMQEWPHGPKFFIPAELKSCLHEKKYFEELMEQVTSLNDFIYNKGSLRSNISILREKYDYGY